MRYCIYFLLLIMPLFFTSAQEFQEPLYDGVPLDVKLAAQNPVSGEIAIALENNPVIIWDAETQQIVREFATLHLQWESIAYSPDGRFLAGGTTDGTTVLYDAATGAALHTEVVESQSLDLAFSSDSRELLISGRWILDTGSYERPELADPSGTCVGTGGTYVPGSDTLITGGSQICIWSASSHDLVKQSDETISGGLNAFEASPTGDSVVVTTNYGPPDALVLNLDGTVRHQLTLTGGSGGLGQVDVANDGAFFLLSAGGSGSGRYAYLVEPLTGQTIGQLDSATFQSPTTYRVYLISGSALVEPDELLLMHGTSGLSFFDLKEARAAAQTLQGQAKENVAQAAVDQALKNETIAQEQEQAKKQEAERQAQQAEAAERDLEQIFTAAREGNTSDLAIAVDRVANVDLDAIREGGRTPLMIAAGSNSPTTARFLVNHGADVNAQSPQGWTALMYAAQDNTRRMVETLVELGADVSRTNEEGKSASDLATDGAVQTYLDQQFQSVQAAQMESDEKRLFELARDGSVAEIADLLDRLSPETFGANPELLAKTNEDGMTPLMIAAGSNEPNVVLTLGAEEQNYNQKTADGWTALMYAAKNGRLDNIEALMTWNLNLLAENNDGDTVFDVAAPDIREGLKARFPGAVRELQARAAPKQPRASVPVQKPSRVRSADTSALMKSRVGAEFMKAFANASGIDVIACPNAELFREIVQSLTGNVYSELTCVVYRGSVQSLKGDFSKMPASNQFIPWQEYKPGAFLAGYALRNGDNMAMIFDESEDMLSFGLVEFD